MQRWSNRFCGARPRIQVRFPGPAHGHTMAMPLARERPSGDHVCELTVQLCFGSGSSDPSPLGSQPIIPMDSGLKDPQGKLSELRNKQNCVFSLDFH